MSPLWRIRVTEARWRISGTKPSKKEALGCWIIAAHGDVSLLSGTTAELLGLVKRTAVLFTVR